MKPHDLKKFQYDIKIAIAIESVEEYLRGQRDFRIYQQNKLLRRAVEREIEIIGEAMNRIIRHNPDIKIEQARKIIDTRNWVIHGYDKVDDVIVWGIVTNHLPKLKSEVDHLLSAEVSGQAD